jgi:hypothetical protein
MRSDLRIAPPAPTLLFDAPFDSPAGELRGLPSTSLCSEEAVVRQALALLAGCASAFFAFYTIRLLVVTSFLTRTRAGGGGAFVGAVVFPLLTLLFAWIAVRLWRATQSAAGRAG